MAGCRSLFCSVTPKERVASLCTNKCDGIEDSGQTHPPVAVLANPPPIELIYLPARIIATHNIHSNAQAEDAHAHATGTQILLLPNQLHAQGVVMLASTDSGVVAPNKHSHRMCICMMQQAHTRKSARAVTTQDPKIMLAPLNDRTNYHQLYSPPRVELPTPEPDVPASAHKERLEDQRYSRATLT